METRQALDMLQELINRREAEGQMYAALKTVLATVSAAETALADQKLAVESLEKDRDEMVLQIEQLEKRYIELNRELDEKFRKRCLEIDDMVIAASQKAGIEAQQKIAAIQSNINAANESYRSLTSDLNQKRNSLLGEISTLESKRNELAEAIKSISNLAAK